MKKYNYGKILLVTLVLLAITSKAFAEDNNTLFPHESLLVNEKMEDELIDTRKYIKFMNLDEKYLLNNDISKEELNKEIVHLSELIFQAEENYVLTEKGAILYSPNIVGNIWSYKMASRNRSKLLEQGKNEKFVYDKTVFYYPQKAVKGKYSTNINPERLLESYKQTKIVLDNIELDKKFLENLVVSVAPFKMVGLNGFTEPFGNYNEGTTLVLGKEVSSLPPHSKLYQEEIKSTVLHELGHVFHFVVNRSYGGGDGINLDTKFWKEYSKMYDDKAAKSYDSKTRVGWEYDIKENFAEDFKTIFSKKLGDYSFEPKKKRTVFQFKKDVVDFVNKYSKKGVAHSKPSLSKSTIKINGKEKAIEYNKTKNYSKKDNIEIEIDTANISKESQLRIWSDDLRELDRINIKNDKDIYNYKVKANSNVSAIIKYEKIGYDYKPLWRINLIDS